MAKREILFRGKRTDNGEWVEGYYVKGEESGKHYIFKGLDITGPHGSEDVTEVDPATIGQFTGLTDKNGVKIFEGDFVRFHSTNEQFASSKVKRSMDEVGADALLLSFGFDDYLSTTYKLYFLINDKVVTEREYYKYSDANISEMKEHERVSLDDNWFESSRDIDFLRYLSAREGLTIIGNIHDNPELTKQS